MPCSYYLPGEEAQIARDQHRKVREELDRVTRLLCAVMTEFGEPDTYRDLALAEDIPELGQWWKEHQEMDRQRETAERLRKAQDRAQALDDLERMEEEVKLKRRSLGYE